jgi:hypothetical protein
MSNALKKVDYYNSLSPEAEERRRRANAQMWRPNGRLEALRRLRAQDPAKFDRTARGGLRIELGHYEAALRDYVNSGGELPADVVPPGGTE